MVEYGKIYEVDRTVSRVICYDKNLVFNTLKFDPYSCRFYEMQP